ncbi:MAG: NUDIX domain-containing protein [Bacilli bacterium]|nr:NUDIX domain-containing protein [Bacilli bacterium]
MFEVKTYDLGYCKEEDYTRVICVCRYKGKYLFSYNKKREGWEIPGGHIEEGESWIDAAKREMYEETGATKIEVTPICVYKISTFGLLCFCEILELDKLPEEYEMSEILLSDKLPDNLTFPESSTLFFNTVKEKMNL